MEPLACGEEGGEGGFGWLIWSTLGSVGPRSISPNWLISLADIQQGTSGAVRSPDSAQDHRFLLLLLFLLQEKWAEALPFLEEAMELSRSLRKCDFAECLHLTRNAVSSQPFLLPTSCP